MDHPKLSGERTAQTAVTEVAAMMGENVKLGGGYTISSPLHGVISTYLHTSPQPGSKEFLNFNSTILHVSFHTHKA